MRATYTEATIKVSEIYLDQGNPRFPPVSSQREAIQTMLSDQGDKILVLASDIFRNGLNPSSRLILFKEGTKYLDGDGNRRLTAMKILETPSLCDSEPKLRKKLDSLLKQDGEVPSIVSCVVFKSREDAKHWISVNHSGVQDGKGQIPWDPEQKNRFEGKYTVGLQALDFLLHKKLIASDDKSRVKKSTLDRLLDYSAVRSQLSIRKLGDSYVFDDIETLKNVVLALRDKKVDEVYTAKKGIAFIDSVFAERTGDDEEEPSLEDDRDTPNQFGTENSSSGSNNAGLGSFENNNHETDSGSGGTASSQSPSRSRRKGGAGLAAFGGTLSLKIGHINNLYRDIELLYDVYRNKKLPLSEDFIVIFRMSLRMLAETAANEIHLEFKSYLTENFDRAKSRLDQNQKTSLSSQGVDKGKIVQLFQTGAHDYHNSRNEEQAVALSVILGAILSITHGKKS